MQRPTKQTRGANADEKRYMAWVKHQGCCFCNCTSGSIVDHCKGSAFKHNKVLIGHWFINSKCTVCDMFTTQGSHNKLFKTFGITDSDATLKQMAKYEEETGVKIPTEVKDEILDVYSTNEDITDWEAVL